MAKYPSSLCAWLYANHVVREAVVGVAAFLKSQPLEDDYLSSVLLRNALFLEYFIFDAKVPNRTVNRVNTSATPKTAKTGRQ